MPNFRIRLNSLLSATRASARTTPARADETAPAPASSLLAEQLASTQASKQAESSTPTTAATSRPPGASSAAPDFAQLLIEGVQEMLGAADETADGWRAGAINNNAPGAPNEADAVPDPAPTLGNRRPPRLIAAWDHERTTAMRFHQPPRSPLHPGIAAGCAGAPGPQRTFPPLSLRLSRLLARSRQPPRTFNAPSPPS